MGRKKKNEINVRSSAAEYLTFVASTGDNQDSVEIRYEDENIWHYGCNLPEAYVEEERKQK
jgi:hypothetical protein